MTPEERKIIISNDYADIIINYNGDLTELEKYKNYVVYIINFFIAVVHIPISQITENAVSKLGYSALPSVFGLVSESSLEATGVFKIRNIPDFNLRGQGVLIGIVDSGIDYTNPIFQYGDKTTKIASLWDQTINNDTSQENLYYGREYTRDEINAALKSDTPFDIVPSKDELGHGTMVAGIAAGNEVPENGFFGVAPEAELVIVKLKPAKPYLKSFFRIPENAACYQENDMLFGYQYLINYAYKVNKPIVVCVALNTSQYAHDGRGHTSSWLSLQSENEGVGMVIAAGNEGSARRHYYGTINKEVAFDTVELKVGENETGFSMELWGTSPNIFTIDITSPTGEYIPRIVTLLNETRAVSFIFEQTVIYVDYQMVESQSGDQLILLRFSKPTPGIWKFKVYGRGIYPIDFNIWLPMQGFISDDTYFIRSNPFTTILSLACARTPIVVTAYNNENNSLYEKAGKGYTRINIIKPDIAAPGVDIVSPSLNQGFTKVTGTSAAAAHTAGVAAMLLEWAIIKGNYKSMNTQDMKMFLIRGARRSPSLEYPNQDWGYGILDVYNVFDIIRSRNK